MTEDEDKSIIVETNFHVYCYTANEQYRAILDLFCKLDVIFPNFVGGIITRERIRAAFRKGITAQQIAMFLNKHAHEQMFIKKDQEEEKDNPAGILVESKENEENGDSNGIQNHAAQKSRKQAIRMLTKETSVIPKNVVDQMHTWEEEMKSLDCKESLLVRRRGRCWGRDHWVWYRLFMFGERSGG